MDSQAGWLATGTDLRAAISFFTRSPAGCFLVYPVIAAPNDAFRRRGQNVGIMETSQSSPTREISRGAVAIAKEHIGRGPTKVGVTITASMVLIAYEESLTPAEKKLVADGDSEFVRLMRRRFQDAVRSEVVGLVERALGRRARTFLSDHDVVKDVGIEVILLDDALDSVERPS